MADLELRKVRAASFGAAADVYERARPPYPDEAIDWLLPPSARRVLDLGAGTGKLSRGLARRGLEVIAVELVSSRSYIITMPERERAAVLARVQHLLGTHPALAGASRITMPYVTRCSRARLSSLPA